MVKQLAIAVIGDGGTDRMLVPIIVWAVRQIDPIVEILEPEFAKRKGSVGDFLRAYPEGPQLVFAHRDAETASVEDRLEEFADVEDSRVVPVIPVRMTEAWLLHDGAAIATAAGDPRVPVPTPRLRDLESLADPKDVLDDLLREAAGRPQGRRRKQFERGLVERRVSVASFVADYSPLQALPAFSSFQDRLGTAYPYGVAT